MRFSAAIPVFLVLALHHATALSQAVIADSWVDSMVRTKAAYQEQRGEARFSPFRSAVLHGGDAPAAIDLDITGLDTLCLEATVGGDTHNYDQAIWGEPELIRADGTHERLTNLQPASVNVGWGQLLTGHNHQDKPLRAGGQTFAFGFWAHAPSKLVFALDGAFVRFTARVGVDDAAGNNGSAGFLVGAGEDVLDALWAELEQAYPADSALFLSAMGQGPHLRWFTTSRGSAVLLRTAREMLDALGGYGAPLREPIAALDDAGKDAPESDCMRLLIEAARKREELQQFRQQFTLFDETALRLAIEDLGQTFPDTYPATAFLTRLDEVARDIAQVRAGLAAGNPEAVRTSQSLLEMARVTLMANPLLDFDQLLLLRRSADSPELGLPANWQGNCALPGGEYKNDIALLSPVSPEGHLESLYRPLTPRFVGDLDLHFDGDKLLFSMPGAQSRFQIWEIHTDGTGLRQVTLGEERDIDNYDACYLPDERIIYGSTACYTGIPCVFGGSYVANLHIMNPDGTGSRQLCVDQDHNWCPTPLNNGRVLYLRWEYSDLPHSNTRILFHMNPDGTNQAEFMNSNSYWPNGVFYARAVPNHPTKVVGVVTGHHGVRRMGELLLFDPAKGRDENAGVIQRIPGRGKPVEPIIRDQLVNDSWPKFLHPYPLSDKYFLVSCKPSPDARWGIYLVDVFDNMLLLHESPGNVLFEPIPVRPTPRPPVIPDRVDTQRKDAVVYLADVYAGPGLDGIPRGTVKDLRVFTYTFSHRHTGGLLGTIGLDGPWDIKRVLGTVPVEEDGSALFRVPASTPIAVQPLDGEGKALQLMRSWFTAMPGEVLSCVGCHEKQSMPPPAQDTLASRREPSEIAPWHGPLRGFSFAREVQPVLDRHCAACHQGETPPDLRGDVAVTDWKSDISGHASPDQGGKFSLAYAELQRYVRRPGIESDDHMLTPMEFHADTTELVQTLAKGHYGVSLDAEAWDRLITWIDLNVPFHGSWTEILGETFIKPIAERRRELRLKYTGMDDDTEWLPPLPEAVDPILPAMPPVQIAHAETPSGWPLSEEETQTAQAELGETRQTFDLGNGVNLELALVPAGNFVMGSATGHPGEQPETVVTVDTPFWVATTEITNAQYACFDGTHDSRVESKHGYQFGVHGYPLNTPEQPVVRISWEEAMAFCAWLRETTGAPFRLPSEAEWEYACRAGSSEAYSFGSSGSDFTAYANFGDQQLARYASDPYTLDVALPNPGKYDDWIPRDTRFDDGGFVSMPVAHYRPNAWGLYDMHGNVWEWTLSSNTPYPYDANDGRNEAESTEHRVVRGGSWYDRPHRASSSYRLSYAPWQRVFNVGFRVVCPTGRPRIARAQTDGAN